MPRIRTEIATRVAASLHETENALDAAIAKASALLGMMPVARQEAHVSAQLGQDAFDRVVAAIGALNDARREMVAAHEAFAEVQARLGLGPLAFGPFIDKPPYPPKQARLSGLSLVESEAA